MKIAVTGATGFIGKALCPYLKDALGAEVIPLNRRDESGAVSLASSDTELINALHKVDSLVHLAARAHSKGATTADFERDNQQLCQRIANIAVAAKIPRVIYLSSIKVNGESTQGRPPFSAEDPPAPLDDYGRSKLASEELLKAILAESGTQLIIIRPPLVYGTNNKGNLASLLRMIRLGIPLPFAGIHNKRDLVSLDNLSTLIAHCCSTPQAGDHTFLVSDGISRSTAEVVKLIAQREHLKARLYRLPKAVFSLLGWIKPDAIARLTGDLQVDISKTKRILGWSPNTP